MDETPKPPRMTFLAFTHRRIDARRAAMAEAFAAVEDVFDDARDQAANAMRSAVRDNDEDAFRKTFAAFAAKAQPFPGKKKLTGEEKSVVDAVAKAQAFLDAERADIEARAFVCLEKDSVIHSVVEGESENGRGVDMEFDSDGLTSCVIHWRNGMTRHVSMPGPAVVAILMRGDVYEPWR